MFTTPRVILLVVSTASGTDPIKYVLVGLAGDTSVGSYRSVVTLASAEACLQPNIATYRDSCSIVSMNCAASLAVPDVKNTSSYNLVGARTVFFVVAESLLADPDFFQGFFPLFAILNTLYFIGIMLIEHYPCLSILLVDWMHSKY